MHPSNYIKALAATIAATIAAGLANAMADGNLTGPEVLQSIGLGLGAGAVVYLAPKNAETS